jgi:hypothetical protein
MNRGMPWMLPTPMVPERRSDIRVRRQPRITGIHSRKSKKIQPYNKESKITVEKSLTTNEAKHTPGTWTVDQWEIGERKIPQIVVRTNSDAIAYVKDLWCDRTAEAKANAHLIAAAPDLLAALKGYLADLEEKVIALGWPSLEEYAKASKKPNDPYLIAKAAVAKAEGRGEGKIPPE